MSGTTLIWVLIIIALLFKPSLAGLILLGLFLWLLFGNSR